MWNEQEKAFCIAAYLRTSDLVETRKLYLRRFNIDRRRINQAPSKGQVIRWAKKFIQSGTVADQSRPGRPKSATSAENMRILKDSVEQSPERSVRHRLEPLEHHNNMVPTGLKEPSYGLLLCRGA